MCGGVAALQGGLRSEAAAEGESQRRILLECTDVHNMMTLLSSPHQSTESPQGVAQCTLYSLLPA